jgi:hypothetical protein
MNGILKKLFYHSLLKINRQQLNNSRRKTMKKISVILILLSIPIILFGQEDDALVVTPEGLVGIGTENPQADLDVIGNFTVRPETGSMDSFMLGFDGDDNLAIELRTIELGVFPFIDFSNDEDSDFDIRINLVENNNHNWLKVFPYGVTMPNPPADWGGGIYTWNLYAQGTIGTYGNIEASGYIYTADHFSTEGYIYAVGNIQSGGVIYWGCNNYFLSHLADDGSNDYICLYGEGGSFIQFSNPQHGGGVRITLGEVWSAENPPTFNSYALSFSGASDYWFTERVHIKGNLYIDGNLYVTGTGPWSDFVFNENYNLMPLPDLKQYIEENKHLPDIPTQEEVEENGINLGSMNVKLLQKIEELTLYIIELKEENLELKQRIDALEDKTQ